MITKKLPFRGKDENEIMSNICSINYKHNSEYKELSNVQKELFELIFIKNSDERPSLNELLKSPYFRKQKRKR